VPYKAEGDPLTAKIVFVGEAPARSEMITGKPFSGPTGFVFNECLENAGILRSDCYITNIFDYPVKKEKGKSTIFNLEGDKLWSDTKEGFTELGQESIRRLEDELRRTTANIICPLGAPAFRAICSGRGITKWRGSILPATLPAIIGRKTVPSIHPANALHGQYVTRYSIRSDFCRAKREAIFPEIRRPAYRFNLRPTFSQCLEILEALKSIKKYACDIEVAYIAPESDPRGQVTRISYAWTEEDAISIPMGDGGWTLEQEAQLWYSTAELLELKGPVKIFQNGIFDCQVLFFIHGILVAPRIEDTMVAHHIVYPDFRKNLAFLASLHTDQPYWKGMVKHGEIENPEG